MKRHIVFFILLSVSQNLYAQNLNTFEYVSPDKIFVEYSKKGNVNYYQIENNVKKYISQEEVNKNLDKMFEEIKKICCSMKIVPESVTGSIGFISATWSTEQICKS